VSVSRRGRLLSVTGEVLITVGAVLMLFAVYQLGWTNVRAAEASRTAAAELQTEWDSTQPPVQKRPPVGKAFAKMYIPRLREKVWGLPVIQGVGLSQLARGVGHYPETAMPGEIGNFATAAHRATNGEPFARIDKLRRGDRVVVQTRDTWYTYRLERDEIVQPDDTWVIDPVPGEDVAPTEEIITLTTCHPRWGSAQRWIWWGSLEETTSKAEGPPRIVEGG
jgi:sortase A